MYEEVSSECAFSSRPQWKACANRDSFTLDNYFFSLISIDVHLMGQIIWSNLLLDEACLNAI